MVLFENSVLLFGLTLVAVTLVCAIGIVGVTALRGRASFQHLVLVTALAAVLFSPVIAIGFSLAEISLIRVPVVAGLQASHSETVALLPESGFEINETASTVELGSEPAPSKVKEIIDIPDEQVGESRQTQELTLPTIKKGSQSSYSNFWVKVKFTFANASWPSVLIAIWMVISSMLLIRLFRRIAVTWRTLGSASPVSDKRLVRLFYDATQKLQIKSEPRFLLSSDVETPIAAGIFSPAVVMPNSLSQKLKEDEMIDVVTHELAHVIRRDSLVLFLQSVVTCLFWPVPLLHVCNHYLNNVREDVCDNFVLASRGAVAYGETLFKIASLSKVNPTKHVAVGMASRKGSLESRIGRIVSESRDCSTNAPPWLGVLSLIVLLMTSSLACGISFATASQGDKQELRTVKGEVLGVDGKPVSKCKLTYTHYAKKHIMTTSSNSKGQFEFEIPDAYYGGRLIAVNPDSSLVGSAQVRPNAPPLTPSELKIQLEECLTTTVKVQHKGKPVSGAVVLGDWDWKTRTDANGMATLRVPFSDPIDSIWVFHLQGAAFWYPTVETSSLESAREKQPKQLTLDLLPSRTCTVEVSTEDGEPVTDFEIFPYFRIEGDSNRKFFPPIPESHAKTNEDGVATFNWIPSEPKNWFIPTKIDKNYRHARNGSGSSTEELRANDQKLVVVKQQPKIDVIGKTVAPAASKGSDLKGIVVQGNAFDDATGFHKFTSLTNSQGEFEAAVLPGLEYHVVAMGDKWSSGIVSATLVHKSGNSNAPVKLKLYPSTPITVNVTQGKSRTPVLQGDVLIEQNLEVRKATISFRRYLRVDSDGQVKFGVGKGKWTFKSRTGKVQKQIYAEVKNERPLTFSAHYEWAGEQKILGRVVNKIGEPVEKADITVVDYQYRSHEFKTQSGARGEWAVNSDVRPNFVVLGFDQQKKLGGLAFVHGPSELPCTVKLAPIESVNGQLMDLAGKPLEVAGVELLLIHEVKVKIERVFPATRAKKTIEARRIICGTATTNSKGEFEFQAMTGVNLRLAYRVNAMNSRYLSKDVKRFKPGEKASIILRVDPAAVAKR